MSESIVTWDDIRLRREVVRLSRECEQASDRILEQQAEVERLRAEVFAVTGERDRARDECHRLWQTLHVLYERENTSQESGCTCTETAWHSACPIHGVVVRL